MTRFDSGSTLSQRFRAHGAALTSRRWPSPLYTELMRRMADDWDAGGVVREICRGWEQSSPSSEVQLRLLGGLHRIVLRGDAPDLARFYPTAGGREQPAGVWPVARASLEQHEPELHEALDIAPQTNESGRSVALLVGLLHAVRQLGVSRVRLLEVGASAGLNLLVDRFRFSGAGWTSGPPASPLTLTDAVHGPVARPLPRWTIVERRGCDLEPVDVSDPAGRLRLQSFVWPDHPDRFHRLRAALAVARDAPAPVDRASAGAWLDDRLADRVESEGALTVVWQSVTRMYWPGSEIAAVERALSTAGTSMPLAHVAMEWDVAGGHIELTVRTWRGDGTVPEQRTLATVADHGIPVTLAPGVALGG